MDNNRNSPVEITFEESRWMMIMMLMIIPFYIVGHFLFVVIWKNREPLIDLNVATFIKYFSVLLAIVIHELIHGTVFAMYASGGFRSVKFGFSRTMWSLYCHCTEAIKIKHYRRAGIAPFIILGVMPYILSLATGVNWLKVFGLLLCIGGFGDLLVWIKLLRYDKNLLVRDHPSKMGFILEQ